MRTTIRLDPDLMREVKRLAVESGRTMTSVIEDAVRLLLGVRSRAVARPPTHLPTFRGQGLLPGIDLDDSAAVQDLLDEERLRQGQIDQLR